MSDHFFDKPESRLYIKTQNYKAIIYWRGRNIKTRYKTFCLGHSLGAHVCGFMGNSGNEILGNGKKALDRIIGLDPAGKLVLILW